MFVPISIVNLIILFFWLSFIWKTYLKSRQYFLIKNVVKMPNEIEHLFEETELIKAKKYQIELYRFSFIHSFYIQIELTVILYGGLILFSWNLVGNIFFFLGFDSSYEIFYTQVWIILTNTFFMVWHQPWELYRIFVLEQKHGFNKMTFEVYIKDLIKSWIVNHLIELPTVAIIVFVVKLGDRLFFLYCWASLSLIFLVILWVYPTWIAPLFDTYTPLEKGELRTKIEELSLLISFPLSEIYIVDSSRKTAHSNAYFYGFGRNKRIVLFDTLFPKELRDILTGRQNTLEEDKYTDVLSEKGSVDNGCDRDLESDFNYKNIEVSGTEHTRSDVLCDADVNYLCNDEILAVVAHELGHWFSMHNLKAIILNEVVLLVYCLLFSLLLNNNRFYQSFGFTEVQPIIIGFIIIFGFIFSPFDLILSFIMNQLIRNFEYTADAFASDKNYGRLLASALIKLTRVNKSFPIDDPLYSIFYRNHPSTLERIRALKQKKVM